MPSAIDITVPVYGNPTTQSVRDNFSTASTEIGQLQADVSNRVAKAGDTMTGLLTLSGDPQLSFHAANRSWVISQIHSTANACVYIGDYDAALDQVLTSGQASIAVGSPLPVASTANTQMYFTVKVGSTTSVGNQPPGGVPAGSWLMSNGVNWNTYQPSASGVTAQTVPVSPDIVGLPGVNVYAALQSVPALYLPKTGGTLTGLLTLSGPPTNNLHAATKAYVDSRTPPTNPTPTFQYINIDNGTGGKGIYGKTNNVNKWLLVLGMGGTPDDFGLFRYDDAGNQAEAGKGIISVARSTGLTTFRNGIQFDPDPNSTAATWIWGRSSNPADPQWDRIVIRSRSDGQSPSYISLNGSTFPGMGNSVTLSNGAVVWNFTNTNELTCPSNIRFTLATSGIYWAASGVDTGIFYASQNFITKNFNARFWIGSDGTFHWDNSVSGQLSLMGTDLFIGDTSNGRVFSNTWICNVQRGLNFNWDGTNSIFSMLTGYFASMQGSIGDWNFWQNNGVRYTGRNADAAWINWGGPMYATAYNPISDEMLKENIKPAPYGLQEILGIEPITYTRNDVHPSKKQHTVKLNLTPGEELQWKLDESKRVKFPPVEEIGFSAQQIQTVFPEAVIKLEPDEPHSVLTFGILPLLAALVNAVKELNERIPK